MVPYKQQIPGTKVSFEMVPIPGGSFELGSPTTETGHKPDEHPQVPIDVEPFWMGKFEVTQAEYRTYMECYQIFRADQRKRRTELTREEMIDAVTAPTPIYSPDVVYEFGDADNEPATFMSHYAARQYSKWISLLTRQNFRLPTEFEWEYAARAGSKSAYFCGNDRRQLGRYAWFSWNSNEEYHPVGMKLPNPWGLHDIYGNVAEMTLNTYAPDAYARMKPGQQVFAPITWPEERHNEVVRGGSWDSRSKDLRSAARSRTDANWMAADPNLPRSAWWFTEEEAACIGFRLVRPLKSVKRSVLETQWNGGPQAEDADESQANGRGVYGVVDRNLASELRKKRGLKELKRRRSEAQKAKRPGQGQERK
jgi:formylglycine-generating enzyme required for sulfatase activity